MSATEANLIAAAGVAVAGSEAVETVVASATVAGAEAVETVIASAAVAGAEVVETVVASAAVAGAEVVGTAMVAADVADAAADRPWLNKDARELKPQRNQIASSFAAEPIGTGVAAAKPAAKLGGSNFIFSVCLGLFAVGFAAVHGQQFALSNMLSRPPLPLPSPPSKLFGLF
eukprot:jgi/Chrpa1/430/Chrysochromulina_OHIO_Genome00012456-RA